MNKFAHQQPNSFPNVKYETLQSGNCRLRNGYILITGATGLVGQYLIKDLLIAGQKLAVVARDDKKRSAQQRIESILKRWEKELGRNLPRPVVFKGDLENDQLSLSIKDTQWIQRHCDRVIHNAAVLKFETTQSNGEPWRTNLEGTINVLSFCEQFGIKELHYVSTAYVSGICQETFCETDFDIQQDFRNDYEASKFEAEKRVRQASGFDSKTIYRPAVIVGDSENGFTASYHGLFLYLRLMATLIPEQKRDIDGRVLTPIQLPMTGKEPRNLVPVDWVSSIISQAVCNPECHDKTFNLTPDAGFTAEKLIDFCCEYFNSTGVQFTGKNNTNGATSDFSSRFMENVQIYSSYDTSDPVFDNSNVRHYFPNNLCPEISKEMIFRYLDFGIENNWGKTKVDRQETMCWLSQQVDDIRSAINKCTQILPKTFGLDLLGPGGGQWSISAREDSEPIVRRGLPCDESPVLTIDQDLFDSWRSRQRPVETWKFLLVNLANLNEVGPTRLVLAEN